MALARGMGCTRERGGLRALVLGDHERASAHHRANHALLAQQSKCTFGRALGHAVHVIADYDPGHIVGEGYVGSGDPPP